MVRRSTPSLLHPPLWVFLFKSDDLDEFVSGISIPSVRVAIWIELYDDDDDQPPTADSAPIKVHLSDPAVDSWYRL